MSTTKTKTPRLRFFQGNHKLGKETWTFSLPAGYTCPGAKDCLTKADPKTGHLVQAKHSTFRCYAASQEVVYPSVQRSRWWNFDLLKLAARRGGMEGMHQLIIDSLPPPAERIRVHVSGDFFSSDYFEAWVLTAMDRPDVVFYAYTKSVEYWSAFRAAIPTNFRLTASLGGRYDELALQMGVPTVSVVLSTQEAKKAGLPIDKDDSHAVAPDGERKSFAVLIHGVQRAGSPQMVAVQKQRQKGNKKKK